MRFRVVVALAAASVLAACSSSAPDPESPSPSRSVSDGPEGTLLRVGESRSGDLSVESDPTWGMHGPFELYRFQATAGERYLVVMSSEDFDSYLVIGTKSGGIFDPINEDDDSGGNLDSRIRFEAPESGTYYILAQAYAEHGEGSYTISLEEMAPPRPAVAVRLPVGGMEEGELSEDDAVDEYEEKFYDLYTFEAQAGRRYSVTMRSDAFDAYLILGHGGDSFEEITRNDDGGDNTDSRILFTPEESGTYAIQATSFSGELGSYTVSVTELAAPGPVSIVPLRLGQDVSGELSETDQLSDDGSYYDVYRFSGREGDRVTIRMSSSDFDSYLELGEDDEEFYADYTDDDGGGGVHARIVATLWRTGDFIVRAGSFYSDAVGEYSLSLSESVQPGPADVEAIDIGDSVEGELEPDDAILDDDTYYDIYTFRATAGTRLSITLRSDDFDSFLVFGRWLNNDIEVLESDDDSGGGFTGYDSQLQLTVPDTGTWAVQVNTINAFETGEYELTVEEQ